MSCRVALLLFLRGQILDQGTGITQMLQKALSKDGNEVRCQILSYGRLAQDMKS